MSGKDRPEGISPTAVEAAPGLWRVDLQKHDLSIPGREVVQSRVEFTPDSPPFKHFHPAKRSSACSRGLWSTRSKVGRRWCATSVMR